MAKLIKLRITVRGWLAASVTAPALAPLVASLTLFFAESVPCLIKLDKASPSMKSLFGYGSIWSSLRDEIFRLILDVIIGPLLTVPLGFVGASLFLFLAFLAAEVRPRQYIFLLAGSAAGGVHAATGIGFARLWHDPPAWLGLILGYLPYGIRSEADIAFGIGAIVAGAVAGWVYWRLRAARLDVRLLWAPTS